MSMQSIESDKAQTNAASAPGENDAATRTAPELRLGDPDFMVDAYATYEKLRDTGSVIRVHVPDVERSEDDAEDQGGFRDIFGKDALFVARYEEAVVALLDEHFSVDPRATMTPEERAKQDAHPVPAEFRPFARSLLAVDPPDHTRLRRLVQPSFSAPAMEAMRPRIQRIADDLLDQAIRAAEERGERAPDRQMELVNAYAYPMPVTVISDMVGIPLADRSRVREWTEKLLTNRRGRRFTKQMQANLKEFVAYLRELFAEKRKHPTDDLASQLVHAKEDNDVLDEDELLSMIFIVYLAGHVTTVNLIGNGVIALLQNPAQAERLRADPSLARGVVEETLRYWGPVDTVMRRIATQDMSLGGTHINKGEHVMVGLAAAGHDARRFPNPEAFDITRADANRHIAFGKGIHLCLGAPLARIEGQIAFETLFRRFPELRLSMPQEELRWSGGFLRGFSQIPLRF